MSRILTQLSACLAVITAGLTALPSASAGHEPPVYCAADRYRDAVVEFERHVHRVRYISNCDERLVDDLEDSTSRLRSAARDCNRLDRLFSRFAETEALHYRVEAQLFGRGHGGYHHTPDLRRCWIHVEQAYRVLASEVRALQGGHRGAHVNPHGYGFSSGVPAPAVHGHAGQRPRYNPDPFYRSEYTPTFRPETFGPRPALNPRAVAPSHSPLGSPRGADLQRRLPAPPVHPRHLTSGNDLRSALIGAFLQRMIN